MKKIEKLKLNSLSECELSKREMQFLSGGDCVCCCDGSATSGITGNAFGGPGDGCKCACGCSYGNYQSNFEYGTQAAVTSAHDY